MTPAAILKQLQPHQHLLGLLLCLSPLSVLAPGVAVAVTAPQFWPMLVLYYAAYTLALGIGVRDAWRGPPPQPPLE